MKPLVLAGFAAALVAAPAFAQTQNNGNNMPSNSPAAASPSMPSSSSSGSSATGTSSSSDKSGASNSAMPSSSTSGAKAQNGSSKDMSNSNGMASDQKAMKSKSSKSASTKTKMKSGQNCYNLAWQSKEMNDCLAKNPGQQQAGSQGQFDKAAPYGSSNQGGGSVPMGGGSGATRATPKPASGNN